MRPLLQFLTTVIRSLFALCRNRQEQAIVELALRHLLQEYIEYYNAERVHTSLGDAPAGRSTDARPSDRARVVGLPRVGGLHHRHIWREAA